MKFNFLISKLNLMIFLITDMNELINFPPTTIQCPEFKSDSCNKNLNYTIFKKKKTMMGKSFHIKVDMGGIYGSKQYKMMNM